MNPPWIEPLLLLCAAHGAPLLIALVLRQHADWPIDAGVILRDGQRLFGASKTWRGVAASLLACGALCMALGYGALPGIAFGLLAMLGDLATSFVKRRRGLASSTSVPLLDQLPEAMLPVALLGKALGVTVVDGSVAVVIFLALDLVGTRLSESCKA